MSLSIEGRYRAAAPAARAAPRTEYPEGTGIGGAGNEYVAVGSPRANTIEDRAGALALYSVTADSVTDVIEGISRYGQFGYAVCRHDDVNADGRPDVLIGAPGANAGSWVFIPGGVAVYGFAELAASHVTWASAQGNVNLASQAP